MQQKIGKVSLGVDWIHRERQDNQEPQELETTSSQLRSRLSFPIAKNLTFSATNEFTLTSETDAVASDRTGLNLNWEAIKGVNLGISQTWFTRGRLTDNSITNFNIGLERDFTFNTGTTITGRYGIVGGTNGFRGQGTIGLNQKLTIAPGLRADLSYEKTLGDFFNSTGSGGRFSQPFASGQSASALGFFDGSESYSVGLEYTDNPDFKASARFEQRNSSGGSNTVISGNVTGKITSSLTGLASYNQASAANQRFDDLSATRNLSLGLAYRDPGSDKFNALLRYEFRQNPSTIPESLLLARGTGFEDPCLGRRGYLGSQLALGILR